MMIGDEQIFPEIEQAGRLIYEVRIRTVLGPDGFPSVATEPPAVVIGMRWAQWKAKRMLKRELRLARYQREASWRRPSPSEEQQ
jgi:hypothetical protein